MSTNADPLAEREIISTRTLPASREKIWRALSDPTLLARWWGPNGFTNTFETFDLRPGGDWRFVMHGPDGAHYANHSTFTAVVPGERFAFEHHSAPHFHATIVFAAVGDRTTLTWRMTFDTAAVCAALKAIIVPANEQNFDRMAAVLAAMS